MNRWAIFDCPSGTGGCEIRQARRFRMHLGIRIVYVRNEKRTSQLRSAIEKGPVALPGAINALTGRAIEQAGFEGPARRFRDTLKAKKRKLADSVP